MKILKRKPQVWRKNDPRMPIGAIYVGRPSVYGNMWSHKPSQVYHVIRAETREQAIEEYRKWIYADAQRELREQVKRELHGKDLCCWCAPEPCHAEILLEIANE